MEISVAHRGVTSEGKSSKSEKNGREAGIKGSGRLLREGACTGAWEEEFLTSAGNYNERVDTWTIYIRSWLPEAFQSYLTLQREREREREVGGGGGAGTTADVGSSGGAGSLSEKSK